MKELIPKNKGDIETANKLKNYSYQEVKEIIPELLEWIQDLNWPVAKPVADYLTSISEHLTNDIIAVLRGTDEVWKYWCITIFGIHTNKSIDPMLIQEFERIANHPTENEILEEVHELAQETVNFKRANKTDLSGHN
ncbi:DUF5071 domain-containing protein [Flagellimonas sp. 2504JD4-2]